MDQSENKELIARAEKAEADLATERNYYRRHNKELELENRSLNNKIAHYRSVIVPDLQAERDQLRADADRLASTPQCVGETRSTKGVSLCAKLAKAESELTNVREYHRLYAEGRDEEVERIRAERDAWERRAVSLYDILNRCSCLDAPPIDLVLADIKQFEESINAADLPDPPEPGDFVERREAIRYETLRDEEVSK